MTSRLELETRLRGYAEQYEREFPTTAGLERRIMARITITPRETRRAPTLRLELALVAVLLLFVAGLVVGIAKLRGLQQVVPAHPTPTVTVTGVGGPPLTYFSALQFASREVGWIAESKGTAAGPTVLYRTIDGGRHWQRQLAWDGPGPAQVRFSSDAMEGLVVGQGGVPLFRTTDGGGHWQRMALPPRATQVQLLYFLDTRQGWVVSYLQEVTPGFAGVFHTTDGGQHWSQTARIDVNTQFSHGRVGGSLQGSLVFRDSLTGWIVTGASSGTNVPTVPPFLYLTHDGGKTWTVQTIPVPAGVKLDSSNAGISLPEFVNQQEGVLLVTPFSPPSARASAAPQPPGAQGYYVYSTTDGGDHWSGPQRLSIPGYTVGFPVLTLIDGQDWVAPAAGPGIVRTTDGGKHWAIRSDGLPANGRVAALDFQDTNDGWAAVSLPTTPATLALYGTTDGGAHWTKLSAPDING